MRLIDLTGQRFGWLVVVERAPSRRGDGNAYWVCQCDCGQIVERVAHSLRQGRSVACTRRGKHRKCSRPGCDRIDHHARGLCGMHYMWWLHSNKAATFSEGTAAYDRLARVPLTENLGGFHERYVYNRNRRIREARAEGFRYLGS